MSHATFPLKSLLVAALAVAFSGCSDPKTTDPGARAGSLPVERLLDNALVDSAGPAWSPALEQLLSHDEIWVRDVIIPSGGWEPIPDQPGLERSYLRFPSIETHLIGAEQGQIGRGMLSPAKDQDVLPGKGQILLTGHEIWRHADSGPAKGLRMTYPMLRSSLIRLVGGLEAGEGDGLAVPMTNGSGRRAVVLPTPVAMTYQVDLPEGAVLDFGYRMMPMLLKVSDDSLAMDPNKSNSLTLSISLETEDGQQHPLWSEVLGPDHTRDFRDAQVKLSNWEGQTVKLHYKAELAEELVAKGWHAMPAFSEPVISGADDSGRPNVIVIVLDTLRADRLGCYGWERAQTPRMDAFAKRGVLFANAMSASSWTLPSHASLFTSTYQSQHGLWDSQRLPEQLTTVAEVMRADGYRTAAFAAGGFLHERHDFDRGFEVFNSIQRDCEPTFALASKWIEARQTPFFAFVHTYQVHSPYDPPEPFRSALVRPYDGELPARVKVRDYEWGRGGPPLGKADIDYVSDLYDAEIAYLDDSLGNFLDGLEEKQILDNTLVIITSDHGEEFFDHGNVLHGMSLYEEQLHIPMLAYWKGHFDGGEVVDHPVHLIDVAPTVTAVAGVPTPASWVGALLSTDDVEVDRPLFTPMLTLWSNPQRKGEQTFAIREGNMKYIYYPEDMHFHDKTPSPALFDLDKDPGETKNLLTDATAPIWAAKAKAMLERYSTIGSAETTATSESIQKGLDELGYGGH